MNVFLQRTCEVDIGGVKLRVCWKIVGLGCMFIFYCNCYVYNYLFMVIVPYDSLVNISFFSYLALSLEQLFFWHMVYSGPKRSRMQHF